MNRVLHNRQAEIRRLDDGQHPPAGLYAAGKLSDEIERLALSGLICGRVAASASVSVILVGSRASLRRG